MTSVMSNYELKDCNGSDEDLKDLDDEDLMDLLFLYMKPMPSCLLTRMRIDQGGQGGFTSDWIGQSI
jgi:hypothetical protein